MNRIINCFFAFLFICLCGCDDIFEKDLSDAKITINTPSDGATTSESAITFWWNEVKGAEYYNIQIVRPTFVQTQNILADTNVENNKFIFSLSPGTYQWRIKACNSSSSSSYQVYSITVDSTQDLSGQTVILINPANNDTTNSITFSFSWNSLYSAENYRFEIWSPLFGNTNVYSCEVTGTSVSYTLPEGRYEWGVKAQNSTTSSPYTKRILVVDLTAPGTPVLSSPANNASISSGNITFLWTRGTHSGSSVRDSLLVCSDTAMTQPVISVFCTSPTHADTISAGTYFWRVKSVDKAGNSSPYSVQRKFTVN